MSKKKSFAVIGLGQFGHSILQELIDIGADVIAIDNNEEVINNIAKVLPTAFIADSTDEKALMEIGIQDVDAAIVAYGGNKEASVLTTVVLREIGVQEIIVRVDDDYYVSIMKKLGATEVIEPQRAAGVALANRLGNEDFKDFYKLDETHSVISMVVNQGFIPKTLMELNTNNKFGVTIVLIVRATGSFIPQGKDSILPNDTLFIAGSTKSIRLFREAVNGKK